MNIFYSLVSYIPTFIIPVNKDIIFIYKEKRGYISLYKRCNASKLVQMLCFAGIDVLIKICNKKDIENRLKCC